MTEQIDQTEAEAYYRRMKTKEQICWSVIVISMVVWGADIWLKLGLLHAGVIEVAASAVMIAVLFMLFTKCPSCKRYGFKGPRCSVCKFPLTRPRAS